MRRYAWGLVLVFVIALGLASCDIIPSNFNVGVDANVDVETTSDLGEDTLERVDAVNETLASGIEVGPETRETIEELNETIANGIKAGFDEETLARVDELLRVVEDGLKIGLDDDTLNTIDGMVDTIDAMPGQWENSAEDVIRTLENSAGTAAGKMAKEIKGIMNEAQMNYQQMTAVTGIEFRCNVDFLGSKAGATVQEFIGKSIIGKIRQVISGEKPADPVPTPWVCQIIPDKIVLSPVGDKLFYEEGIISLTGYNYVDNNNPTAFIQDENGSRLPGFTFPVYRTSPYQLQLNLQQLDLSPVPARARLVVAWPNVAETSGISILLPANEAPVASFSANPTSGDAPLSVQFSDLSRNNPTQWEWVFSDGSTSNEQNPSHTYTDGGSFDVRLTATNSRGSSSITQIIQVGTPLKAEFTFSNSSGDIPLVVKFKDQSSGSPTSWLWDFGDGQTSTEPEPTHVYEKSNSEGYQVSLTITNATGSQTFTSPTRVYTYQPVTADFTSTKSSGTSPLLVQFTDTSKGEIVARLWEFGDGETSTLLNPLHSYDEAGIYDVKLTVTRADGEKNTKTRNGMITVTRFNIQAMAPLLKARIVNVPANSLFFTTFTLTSSYQQLNTGISAEKYVCAIAGMEMLNSYVNPDATTKDPFTLFTFSQYSPPHGIKTWWITAGFPTLMNQFPVDLVCINRSLQQKVFTYWDNFKNIDSGEAVETGIKTSSSFLCSIAGATAIGPGSMPVVNSGDTPDDMVTRSVVSPVVLQAYMDGSGEEWTIHVDMALQEEEKWNVNVLCFQRAYFSIDGDPLFKVDEVTAQGGGNHFLALEASADKYVCSVGGWSAENGDQGFEVPRYPRGNPIGLRPFIQNSAWWVYADHMSVIRDETFRVKYWCMRKPYAVVGVPTP